MVLSSEGLLADIAREWALIGVCSFVDPELTPLRMAGWGGGLCVDLQQIVRLGELAPTVATNEFLLLSHAPVTMAYKAGHMGTTPAAGVDMTGRKCTMTVEKEP